MTLNKEAGILHQSCVLLRDLHLVITSTIHMGMRRSILYTPSILILGIGHGPGDSSLSYIPHMHKAHHRTLDCAGWCFVRPSGTENVVRVYAEAASQTEADGLANAIAQLIPEHCPGSSTSSDSAFSGWPESLRRWLT